MSVRDEDDANIPGVLAAADYVERHELLVKVLDRRTDIEQRQWVVSRCLDDLACRQELRGYNT